MDFFSDAFITYSEHLGYWGITVLMAIESSFLPLPSEIIIPPAAFMASQGKLNLWVIIISGTIGSILGAVFNYYIAYRLGRPIIFKIADSKYAKVLLINSKKIIKAENYFLKYGNTSTFVGRLIPVIRHLISLPAGFSKMNMKNFLFFTAVGSFIWVCFLAFLGYFLGANQELIIRYYEVLLLVLVAVAILAGLAWHFLKIKRRRRNESQL